MTDSLTIFGDDFTNVTGIKATGTGNGTLTYIRPQGTKSISANGTGIDVEEYASVDVAVPAPTPTLQSKTKSYTPSEFSESETVTADSGYDGLSSVAISVGAISSTYVGSGVTRRSSTDLTASGATVTVPAGYYAEQASKAVASGSAGTPTATKGTVSNHAVSVTPSVTNGAGYIEGGTKTGTAVSVSASELVSGNKAIAENGTNIDVTDYATVSVNVAGGSATYRLDNIVPEQTVACTTASQNNSYYVLLTFSAGIEDSEQYLVTFDGTEYVCEGYVPAANTTGVGDVRVTQTTVAQYLITPFYIGYQTGNMALVVRGSGTHTIKVDKLTFIDDGETFTTKTITQNGTYSASSDNADGYSSVTVNVSGGSSKNVQVAQSTSRATSSTYTSVCSLTCSTAGTYDVYWDCFRSSTGGTSGSQLYIGGNAYGSANTAFTDHAQTNHLTGVSLSKNQTVAVYARSRGSNYYAYCGQLTIVQTA